MRLSSLSRLLAVSAAAAATQIPLGGDSDRVGSTHISASLFAELEELSRLVDIAYCVGLAGSGIQKPFECLSRCGDFKDLELVTAWNTGPLLSDSCGYVAVSHPPSPRRVIVAFRGTYSIANTVADLATIPQEYIPYPAEGGNSTLPDCINCTVHTGFYTSWLNTRDVVLPAIQDTLDKYPGCEVTLVGHSLGGAVATLGALELLSRGYAPIVTTFGEPRVGNEALANYIDESFNLFADSVSARQRFRRVTHINDPVPLLPPEEFSYRPHGGEIFISKVDLPPSVADIHHCHGAADPSCIVGPEDNTPTRFRNFPPRLKLWQLFFAHRNYFWSLGLCVPSDKWPWHLPYLIEN